MSTDTDEKGAILPKGADKAAAIPGPTPSLLDAIESVETENDLFPADETAPDGEDGEKTFALSDIPAIDDDEKSSGAGLPPELIFNFDDDEEQASGDADTGTNQLVSDLRAELRQAVPYSSEIFSLIEMLLRQSGVDAKRFLEIGCGDAILSKMLLKVFPGSTGVLLDVDEASLSTAWRRLGEESARMAFVAQDISDTEWAEAVKNVAPFDIILSSFVIDRQIDEHKVNIYSDIFEMLSPGGLFFNLDLVSISAPFARKVFDSLYIDSLANLRATRAGGQKDRAAAEKDYLDRPDKSAIIPSQTDVQCDWLREIGFVGVDCFFRSLGIAFFGGAKPRKISANRNE